MKAMEPIAVVEEGAQRPDLLLARMRREFRHIWAAADQPASDENEARLTDFQVMPPITASEVQEAWLSFRQRTSVTDGLLPRSSRRPRGAFTHSSRPFSPRRN